MSESGPCQVTVTLHLYTEMDDAELAQDLMRRLDITAGEIAGITRD